MWTRDDIVEDLDITRKSLAKHGDSKVLYPVLWNVAVRQRLIKFL